MRQLIDKTVLRKELSKLPSEMGFVRKSDVMQILGSQKCAYDVDNVVKELSCNECQFCQLQDVCNANMLDGFMEKICEIVKAGGTCQ